MATKTMLETLVSESRQRGTTTSGTIYKATLDEVVDALCDLVGEDFFWSSQEKGKNARFGWDFRAQESENDPSWTIRATIER